VEWVKYFRRQVDATKRLTLGRVLNEQWKLDEGHQNAVINCH